MSIILWGMWVTHAKCKHQGARFILNIRKDISTPWWQLVCFVFSLRGSWNWEHESTMSTAILHLVPGGIIWCFLNPIIVIKIHNLNCFLPGTTSREEARTENIKYSAIFVHEPRGFYCQRCSDETQRDWSGTKTTIKLWSASNKTLHTSMFFSSEEGLFVIMALCVFTIRRSHKASESFREWFHP